jgi:hypothetical protein
MINHPEVEIYYERESGEEYLSEDYEVFVDEDCTTCHDSFLPQKHFSPFIPAHDVSSNWKDLPWWLDTKYLMFFSENDDSTSGGSGYQHVNTYRRNDLPAPQQGGYVSGSGGSSTTSSSSNTSTATTATKVNEGSDSNSRSRSSVTSQNSGSSSKSGEPSSKRKFRKRK